MKCIVLGSDSGHRSLTFSTKRTQRSGRTKWQEIWSCFSAKWWWNTYGSGGLAFIFIDETYCFEWGGVHLCKVHLFWEGHKIWLNFPLSFDIKTQNYEEGWAKLSWPSQKTCNKGLYNCKHCYIVCLIGFFDAPPTPCSNNFYTCNLIFLGKFWSVLLSFQDSQ